MSRTKQTFHLPAARQTEWSPRPARVCSRLIRSAGKIRTVLRFSVTNVVLQKIPKSQSLPESLENFTTLEQRASLQPKAGLGFLISYFLKMQFEEVSYFHNILFVDLASFLSFTSQINGLKA